jgi:hypothetical protein
MIKNDLSPNRLTIHDLRALSAWCAARRLSWAPGRSEAADQVVVLEAISHSRFWPSLQLHRRDRVYRLTDPWGEPLAEASGLHGILDALDGGIASTVLPVAAMGRALTGI